MYTSDWINLIAAILIGGGTLFLGIMAWRTIRQTRNIQKAEKRERLLNEIIEWSINVFNCDIEALQLVNVNDAKAYIMNLQQRYEAFNVKSKYIIKMASLFGRDLRIAVEKVTYDLGEHIKNLHHLYKDEVDAEEVGKHRYTLKQSANKLIEEAAKIKTKDIN